MTGDRSRTFGAMSARRALADERGIALLTVLGLLAIMLVLGSLVAASARIEAVLSGTARRGAEAFQAADAGLGYALGDADNFVQLATRTTDLHSAGLPVTGTVAVTYKYEAPPPIEIHVSAMKFKGFYFDVNAAGTARTNALSALNMQATRLGPAQ